MSVITKKSEKIKATIDTLDPGFSFEEFLAAFQAQYPKDWEKVQREYAKHERKKKLNKSPPMPEPVQYIRNALNVYLKVKKEC